MKQLMSSMYLACTKITRTCEVFLAQETCFASARLLERNGTDYYFVVQGMERYFVVHRCSNTFVVQSSSV